MNGSARRRPERILAALLLGACAAAAEPEPVASLPPAPAAAPSAEPVGTAGTAPDAVPPPAPADPAGTPAPTPAPHGEAAPSPAAPPPSPAREGFPLRGSVTYLDGKPAEWFAFVLSAEGLPRIYVNGKAGRFEQRVTAEGSYRLSMFIADGDRHPYLPSEVEVVRGLEVEFRIERETAVRLLVVDAESGAPVPDAFALRANGPRRLKGRGGRVPQFRPGESQTIRGDDEGRIEIGRGRGTEWIYVTADGRAWTQVEIPWAAGGEVRVPLQPGGSVRLRIPGWSQLEGATVSLSDETTGESWVLPNPGRDEELVVRGLWCGTATFAVRRGGTPSERDRGRGSVDVVAGEERTLILDVEIPEARETVFVTGTIRFHEAWKRTRSLVRFTGAEESNDDIQRLVDAKVPAHGSPLVFHVGKLPAGWYQVEVEPQWRTVVDVSSEESEFDFEIPEPAEIRLQVVEDETGKPVRRPIVHWHRPVAVGSRYHPTEVTMEPGAREFVIRACPGPVVITVDAPDRVSTSNTGRFMWDTSAAPTYSAGEQAQVTLRMEAAGALTVVLRRDGTSVSEKDVEVWLRLAPGPEDPENQVTSWGIGSEEGRRTRNGIPVGVHMLEVRDKGYLFEPVPNRPVEILAGKTVEVEIDLVRRK